MRNIIILTIFAIMLGCIKFNAQQIKTPIAASTPCDEYIQDSNLDKFVGTWKGSLNNKELTLILTKQKIHYRTLIPNVTTNLCQDAIVGFHKFIQNGNILENSTEFSSTTVYQKKWTVLGGKVEYNDNQITGTLEHPIKNKSVRFVISYIDATHIKIDSLENLPGIRINVPGQPPYDSSIDLPINIVLTKQ